MPGSATNRLLDALDAVLNSNSFLLDHDVSEDADTRAVLSAFLPSVRFRELLAQADLDRGWRNYVAQDEVGRPGASTLDERLYIADAKLSMSEIEQQQLRDDLLSLLTTSKSPHQKQLAQEEARTLVDDFLHELA